MTDLIPIALFVGCLLATLGLLRVCDRLRPHVPAGQHGDHANSPGTHAARGRVAQ